MKGSEKFKRLCEVQVGIICFILFGFCCMQDLKVKFEGVNEFVPVRAEYVRPDVEYYAIYSYEVNGHSYSERFRYGMFSKFSKKEKYIEVYYHPDNPEICSEYRTYREANRANVFMMLFGLFVEGYIIYYVYKSLSNENLKWKKQDYVVLNEDYDSYLKLDEENITKDQSVVLYTEEEYEKLKLK